MGLSLPVDPPPLEESSLDEPRMRLALAEAAAAAAAGEVPVGAVLFRGDQLIAAGQNRMLRDNDPTAHAEVVALRAAGATLGNYRLPGCILYCTLEPCAMCAGAVTHARLFRLVYGARDAKAGADGSVLSVLNYPRLNHQVRVTLGVLQTECAEQLRSFFLKRRMNP